ncbi:MAG: TSUP family transporter [Magnetococcus sp. YQC-5]
MFCQSPWKIIAVVIVLIFFATIGWGFYLLDDLEREVKKEKSGHPYRGIFTATLNSPADWRMRAALVNVAGMTKPEQGQVSRFVSAGSGVIVTPNGYVATGQHVIEKLQEIQVRLQSPDGPRHYPAQLVKAIPQHDLAVIKIVSRDLFPFAPLEPARPGVILGDAVTLWGDPHGVDPIIRQGAVMHAETQMVVEGSLRTHLIQTSAPSHWSQSGGPMVNVKGRVVGINVVLEAPGGLVQGYAIPTHVLLAHFQDVVNFPVLNQSDQGVTATPVPSPSRVPAPVTLPAASMAMVQVQPAPVQSAPMQPGTTTGAGQEVAGRERRPADDWWARAAQVFGRVGNQPPQAVGLYAAAQESLAPASVLVDGSSQNQSWRLWGLDAKNLIGLLILGLVSGLSGGMMTMGGGIIKVSGLILFFGYGMLLIRPVVYLTNIFMYGAAALRYQRYELIHWSHTRRLIPWAVLGVVIGYFLGNVIGTLMLHYLLGGFALLVGVKMVAEIIESQGWAPKGWPRWFGTKDLLEKNRVESSFNHGILGLSLGVVSGILGITGGVVEVPLQRYLARMPLRNAIANSAVLVFFASLAGSVVVLLHGVLTGGVDWWVVWHLAIILIPGAYVGGWIGAWMTRVAPLGVLRWLYAVLMFVIAGRMFWI